MPSNLIINFINLNHKKNNIFENTNEYLLPPACIYTYQIRNEKCRKFLDNNEASIGKGYNCKYMSPDHRKNLKKKDDTCSKITSRSMEAIIGK